jgi:3-carboxy-cis,cis-muconate cycloisomerase
MAVAVSDSAWLAALLRFEAALSAAQAARGLLPAGIAAEIAAACKPERLDLAAIGQEAIASATPVVPLLDALRSRLGADAARSVHMGATSQDALDTAMMLVSRDALDLLLADLSALAEECAGLAERHRDTPMAGRTLLQQARPITFGFKAAMWLAGVLDARRRLAWIRAHRLAVQLGGPVGTQDTFGDQGPELAAALARELGLAEPELPWHSARGRVAELGSALAIAAGASAKIALDVALLAQTEVGEVAEAAEGRSSAMPHKRNPARAVEARAAFAGVAAQAGVLLAAMAGEHERAAGAWQAEWPAISEAFRLTAGAVSRSRESLTGLRVDAPRMLANLRQSDEETQPPGDLEGARRLVDRALAIYHDEEAVQ